VSPTPWKRAFAPKAPESTKRFVLRLGWQVAFITLAMLSFVSDYTSLPERIIVLGLWGLCLAILVLQAVARYLHGRARRTAGPEG
jgi:hypothetical protein